MWVFGQIRRVQVGRWAGHPSLIYFRFFWLSACLCCVGELLRSLSLSEVSVADDGGGLKKVSTWAGGHSLGVCGWLCHCNFAVSRLLRGNPVLAVVLTWMLSAVRCLLRESGDHW